VRIFDLDFVRIFVFVFLKLFQNWIQKQIGIHDENALYNFSCYIEPRTGTNPQIPPELAEFWIEKNDFEQQQQQSFQQNEQKKNKRRNDEKETR
jgi:hypothetical protein